MDTGMKPEAVRQRMWRDAVRAWASLGKWDRVGIAVGAGLLLSAAGMAADSRLIRREAYRQYWIDKEHEKYARQVTALLKPAYQQQLGITQQARLTR
mmetsp:Transcript_2555/g.6807  ORF Transcript_2555/g.6807 Transcript_2555/m.6807 type:complete len:97 (-) Transcript_2555:195-485(-)